jgi:prevent-host-death family protein
VKTYNIAEAKAHFSELVKRALLGEKIVIARNNKPLLRLMPVAEDIQSPVQPRGRYWQWPRISRRYPRILVSTSDASPAFFHFFNERGFYE